MGKKLKRDFKERQRARIEKETLQSNGSIEPEESKLKHGDDYRGKIIHDKDRFQDKVHEKESKRNYEKKGLQVSPKRKVKQPRSLIKGKEVTTSRDDESKTLDESIAGYENNDFTSFENGEKVADKIIPEMESIKKEKKISFEEQKADLLKKRKIAEKVRKNQNLEETFHKNEEVYDPLGKDLDNDGIIDRYDNDFRDSDYFESTYDVEDNLHHKVEDTKDFSKSQKAQKKKYKRKNYSDKVYTRKKKDAPTYDKTERKKTEKDLIQNREKKNRISKEQEIFKKKNPVKVSALSGLAKSSETVRDYLSHGSDENQGVEAGEKTADTSQGLFMALRTIRIRKEQKKDMILQIRTIKLESENLN